MISRNGRPKRAHPDAPHRRYDERRVLARSLITGLALQAAFIAVWFVVLRWPGDALVVVAVGLAIGSLSVRLWDWVERR